MKIRLIITALLLGTTLVAAVVVKLAFFPTSGVTAQNFQRLHRGMAEEEVEEVLGQKGEGTSGKWRPIKRWVGEACVIEIEFDSLFRETYIIYEPADQEPILKVTSGFCDAGGSPRLQMAPNTPSPVDRFRAWLGI